MHQVFSYAIPGGVIAPFLLVLFIMFYTTLYQAFHNSELYFKVRHFITIVALFLVFHLSLLFISSVITKASSPESKKSSSSNTAVINLSNKKDTLPIFYDSAATSNTPLQKDNDYLLKLYPELIVLQHHLDNLYLHMQMRDFYPDEIAWTNDFYMLQVATEGTIEKLFPLIATRERTVIVARPIFQMSADIVADQVIHIEETFYDAFFSTEERAETYKEALTKIVSAMSIIESTRPTNHLHR